MADVGKAYVEVLADTEKFPEDLRAKMKAAAAEATGSETFSEMDKNMEKAGKEAGGKLADEAGKEGEKKAKDAGKKTGNSFVKNFGAAMKGLGAAMLPGLIGMAVAIGAYALPAVQALAAAFPALAATAIVSSMTIKMAMSGVKDALAGAMSATPTAAQLKAFQDLTPAAQSFVLMIKQARPELEAFKKTVQQAFFTGLNPGLKEALTLLPMLRADFKDIANALGGIAGQVARAFSSSRGSLDAVLIGIHVILRDIGPMLAGLVKIFLDVSAVALPFVDQLLRGFSDFLDKVQGTVHQLAGSGGLNDFFRGALVIVQNLGAALGAIGHLIGDIVDALAKAGGQSLAAIAQVAKMLGDFFASAQGQQALVTLVQLLNQAFTTLAAVVVPLLPGLAQLIIQLGPTLTQILKDLTPGLSLLAKDLSDMIPSLQSVTPLIEQMANWLGQALTWLGKHPDVLKAAAIAWGTYRLALIAVAVAEGIVDALDPATWIILAIAAITAGAVLIVMNWKKIVDWAKKAWEAIKDAWGAVVGWFKSVGKAIGDWVSDVISWFEALPGKIEDFLTSLPGKVEHLFKQVYDKIAYWVGYAIGWTLGEMIRLPGRIVTALIDLPLLIGKIWESVWDWSTKKVGDLAKWLGDFFIALPGKIWKWLEGLPAQFGKLWESVWDWSTKKLDQFATNVGKFFKDLPKNMLHILVQAGKDIANFFIDAINSAIDGVNKGLADAHIPPSVLHFGHIPRLAEGALINGPTQALIGEAGPEVVIPLTKPARAQQLADQSGLTHILNAGLKAPGINVNVLCMLDSGDFVKVIDTRVTHGLDREADLVTSGPRTGGF